MKKLYVLFQNVSAGELFIRETDDDNFSYQELGGVYATNIFESSNEDEVMKKYDEIIEKETKYVVLRGTETDRIEIIKLQPNEGSIQDLIIDLSSYYVEPFKEVCICNSKEELISKGYEI